MFRNVCFNDSTLITQQLSLLDGDFAFVIIDEDTNEVLVARDLVGVRPLFYGCPKDSNIPIAFASEAKALYKLPYVDSVHVFPIGS
jgi:asparagine synthase (glutamine-hydrolysing)